MSIDSGVWQVFDCKCGYTFGDPEALYMIYYSPVPVGKDARDAADTIEIIIVNGPSIVL